MKKTLQYTFFIFIALFIIDQYIKYAFVFNNWGYEGSCLSFQLAYNYGVAFSMFSFLKEYLKYIQLAIVLIGTIYLFFNKEIFKAYYFPIALLYAGGLSNILDRFTYGAVVDYVYWHCGFEFAIFNFADVIIDIAVVIIIYMQIKQSRANKS